MLVKLGMVCFLYVLQPAKRGCFSQRVPCYKTCVKTPSSPWQTAKGRIGVEWRPSCPRSEGMQFHGHIGLPVGRRAVADGPAAPYQWLYLGQLWFPISIKNIEAAWKLRSKNKFGRIRGKLRSRGNLRTRGKFRRFKGNWEAGFLDVTLICRVYYTLPWLPWLLILS